MGEVTRFRFRLEEAVAEAIGEGGIKALQGQAIQFSWGGQTADADVESVEWFPGGTGDGHYEVTLAVQAELPAVKAGQARISVLGPGS